jgi:hypothetical protein
MLLPIACKKREPPIVLSDFVISETKTWNVQKLEEYFFVNGY